MAALALAPTLITGPPHRRKLIASTEPFPKRACPPARTPKARDVCTCLHPTEHEERASRSKTVRKVCTALRGRSTLYYRKVG